MSALETNGDSRLRIEICGGIASGKTTLCMLLKRRRFDAILESFHQNPFWSVFYQDPSFYAFEAEVTFLMQHYSLIKSNLRNRRHFACDFSFLQDLAYASINLRGDRFQVFCNLYEHVLLEVAPPSFLIHLECPVEEELARIRRRARAEELGIKGEYLDALNQSIVRAVSEVREKIPTIIVDSSRFDFAHDAAAQESILAVLYSSLNRHECFEGSDPCGGARSLP